MHSKLLKRNNSFFLFLFDSNTSKAQKQFLLTNLSKTHLQSIVEVLYNISNNRYIKLPPPLQKVTKQNHSLIQHFSSSKALTQKKLIIKRHYRLIYHILVGAKDIIFQVIENSNENY